MKKNKYAIIKYTKEIKSKKELFQGASTYAEESKLLAKFTNLQDAKKYLVSCEGSCRLYSAVVNYYLLTEYCIEQIINEDEDGYFDTVGILKFAKNPDLKKRLENN